MSKLIDIEYRLNQLERAGRCLQNCALNQDLRYLLELAKQKSLEPSPVNGNHKAFTVREVCERLHVNRTSVYERITAGAVKTVKLGRSVRISSDELERILREGWE